MFNTQFIGGGENKMFDNLPKIPSDPESLRTLRVLFALTRNAFVLSETWLYASLEVIFIFFIVLFLFLLLLLFLFLFLFLLLLFLLMLFLLLLLLIYFIIVLHIFNTCVLYLFSIFAWQST